MKKCLIVLLCFYAANIYSQEWIINKNTTKIAFVIKNFGVNVDGNFNDFSITTNFSKDDLKSFRLNARIEVKSIETGMRKRDEHLFKESYFNEQNYPNINFTSNKIQLVDDKKYIIFGQLQLKDIVKEIQIPASIEQTTNTLKIDASFSINRKDYNINGGGFVLSNIVDISINYQANKQIEE